MPWCGPWGRSSVPTPLERFAQTLRDTCEDDIVADTPLLFPMYTVPLEDVLKMRAVRPHEELKAHGVLVMYDVGLGNAAFVSHQWIGGRHPDPHCEQLQVLQDALRRLRSEVQMVHPSFVTEFTQPACKGLPTKKLFLTPLFLWYDYFSCPQHSQHSLELAIRSIPEYIARCTFFFALCPVIADHTSSRLFTQYTWAERGWCRMEKACRELSVDHTWILIQSSKDVNLVNDPATTLGGPVGEGQFTDSEDRARLAPVLLSALKRKLLVRLKDHDLAGYRGLLNLQLVHMRGFPRFQELELISNFSSPAGSGLEASFDAVQPFFHQNGFVSITEVDSVGWSPLHYAAIRGDAALIQALLDLRADPNAKTRRANPVTGFRRSDTALNMCLFHKHNDAVRTLLAGRARVDDYFRGYPACAAAIADNAEGVRLLCEAGGNPSQPFLGVVYPFTLACMFGATAAIDELAARDAAHLQDCLSYAMIFRGGTPEMAFRLISMRADVNYRSHFPLLSPLGVVFALKSLEYRCGRVTPLTRVAYRANGRTPLMNAIMGAHYDGAAALLLLGAQVDLRDSGGASVMDIAREQSVPDFVQRGFQRELEGCRSVVQLHMLDSLEELVEEAF
ncbi:Btbd11 [Symbiodinium sp. CCMP2456]|nr:Btbd11 [Symbiodinium sp. CCMP2456]